MEKQVSVENKRYIFVVSDATGETCLRVAKSALSQFKTTKVVLEKFAFIRTREQIVEIVHRAAEIDGIIIYTMVTPECRQDVTELGRQNGVPTLDILGPVLTRFSDLLEISPMAKPGLFRQLDSEYFNRIQSIDYTIKHDDSLGLSTLGDAEIVLVGASRTTKTPVSIYLSYRGWKVANIPIIIDRDPPEELLKVDKKKIVAFTVNPQRLHLIRLDRKHKLHDVELREYTDPDHIKREVLFGLHLYKKHDWSIINVTYKSIEETSTEVMRMIYRKSGIKKGRIH